jgi:hypothetical protein
MKQKIFALFLMCAVILSACAAPAAPAIQTVVVTCMITVPMKIVFPENESGETLKA